MIALGIEHLVVMGHHGCGGVRGCHDMLAGLAPDLDTPTSFVGTWLKILKPGFEALAGRGLDYEARIAALERGGGAGQPAQPDDLPLRRRGGRGGRLQLHGVWKDIRDGDLELYDAATGSLRAALSVQRSVDRRDGGRACLDALAAFRPTDLRRNVVKKTTDPDRRARRARHSRLRRRRSRSPCARR